MRCKGERAPGAGIAWGLTLNQCRKETVAHGIAWRMMMCGVREEGRRRCAGCEATVCVCVCRGGVLANVAAKSRDAVPTAGMRFAGMG